MQPEIEKILGTLELLTQPSLTFDLPYHEDGGNFVPFAWDVSEWGKFNIRNLCRSNGWLQITDADATVKDWQNMEYLRYFPDFNVSLEQQNFWRNKIELLFQLLQNNLTKLESFFLRSKLKSYCWHFKSSDYRTIDLPGMIIGETKNGDWIGISHTFYKLTEIPPEIIYRSEEIETEPDILLEENTLDLIAKIQAVTSDLGTIHLAGDFGGGYDYTYDHKFVFTVAKTKELVFEKIIQATKCLEINQFYSLYPNMTYLEEEYYSCYGLDKNELSSEFEDLSERYNIINRLFQQIFDQTFIYRFSFWIQEYIYVLGQTPGKNLAGLYLESEF
ncbi:MAG: hypothetical protein WBA93_29165, partial [Microcoleaceae cyanobacterium]